MHKHISRSMLMITVTLLGSLVVGVGTHSASAHLGLTKAYGPSIGSAQPYEPAGPWIDGVLIPQFLVTQDFEWQALKAGDIDVYDWAMRKSQVDEFNANICIPAPDAAAGIAPCGAGQAPIQHEIAIQNPGDSGKFEVDMQNARFPTNVLQFRQAMAYIVDKENFTTNFLGGLGFPLYTALPCPIICSSTGQWVDPSLLTATAEANHVYGSGLPTTTRVSIAQSLLDSAGLFVGLDTGFREDCRGLTAATCTGKPVLQPTFRVRLDDPNRLALGRFIRSAAQNQLKIDMDIGGTSKYTGDVANYFEQTRSALFNSVFFLFDFNLYTGGWGGIASPTILNDLYSSKFIRAGSTNYPNFNDPIFDIAAAAVKSATGIPSAVSAAHAAEIEYNASIPVIDVWSSAAPLAYRLFHKDNDLTLNGRQWDGFQLQTGVGWHGGFSWLNIHLIGAPLHDPNHPVFVKWGWKTDLLDSPNPIDSSFLWDAFAIGLTYDFLNNGATDDISFSGSLPWAGSLPLATLWTGTGCAVSTGCSALKYQLRPDLHFADGSQVTAQDVAFSIHVGRDSPTSFITPQYILTKNVTVTGPLTFTVFETNAGIFNRNDIGATPLLSQNLWCTSRGFTVCNPDWALGASGWPAFPDRTLSGTGVNILSSNTGPFSPGTPVGTNFGSYAFVYDSTTSFTGGPSGPILFRTAGYAPTGTPAFVASAPRYFTDLSGGWKKFHLAGNVNWYCTACTTGPSETGPLPSADMVINIVDLATVALHFNQNPGLGGTLPFGSAPWDISGPTPGVPDGTVNILDLVRVALHFGQSFLGGTDIGGGAEGAVPGWASEP